MFGVRTLSRSFEEHSLAAVEPIHSDPQWTATFSVFQLESDPRSNRMNIASLSEPHLNPCRNSHFSFSSTTPILRHSASKSVLLVYVGQPVLWVYLRGLFGFKIYRGRCLLGVSLGCHHFLFFTPIGET